MADLGDSRQRAQEAVNAGKWGLRSCWNCNPAHAHLAVDQDWVLQCFDCGHFYFEGVDITTTDVEAEVA